MITSNDAIEADWGPSPFEEQGAAPKVIAVASHDENVSRFLDANVYRVGKGIVWSMIREHPDLLAQGTGGAVEVERGIYESAPLFTTKKAADEAALCYLIENELIDGLLLDASFGIRFSVLSMRRSLQEKILGNHRSGKVRAHMVNFGNTPAWAREIAGGVLLKSDDDFIESLYLPHELAPHRDTMRMRLQQAIGAVKSKQPAAAASLLHVIDQDGRREAV